MIVASRQQAPSSSTGRVVSKGRLRQSVCRWCYSKIPLPEFFTAVAAMGLTAVDLLTEKEWPIAREHGLICSMGSGAGGSIADGLNVKANHEEILAALTRALPIAAARKVPNLITFFGNRRGMGDPEAAANCIEALNRDQARRRGARRDDLRGAAQQQGGSQGLSGRSHGFRRGDREGGGSPRVKLLYDIYHMQIMEGDVIRTIQRQQATTSRISTPAASRAATSWTTPRS